MIVGLLAMLVANAAALLGAHALLDRVRTQKPSADLTLFLLIHLLLISVAIIVAGVLRLLNPVAMGAAGAVALALLLARGQHRRLPRLGLPEWGLPATILAALLLLRLLLQVWFFAPYLGDSLAYHLPKIAEWVQAGGFTEELGTDLRSTFPAGFELVETWWVVFLHHDVLIEMAGVEFLFLGGAAVHAISSGLGWSAACSRIAAFLFMLGPGVYFQATSCVNDGAVAALTIATVGLVVADVHPVLVLVPILLGAGVKPTFLYALPGLALIAALMAGRDGADAPRARGTGLLLASAALLVGSWWYLRNWTVYGNPIYPMSGGGMRSPLSGSTLQRLGPSLRALQENLSCFLDIRIYDSHRAPDALCTDNFGWGAAAFALGSVAMIPVLRAETLFRRVAVGLGVSLFCVFTLVELDTWSTRFVVSITVLPALALARLWERHRFVAILGGFAVASQILGTMVPGNLPPEGLSRMRRQGWMQRSAVAVPPDAGLESVGFLCDYFGGSYPLYRPDFSRRVIYLRETTAEDLLARLDREGLKVVYFSNGIMKRSGMLDEACRRGRLKPFERDSWKGYDVLPAR